MTNYLLDNRGCAGEIHRRLFSSVWAATLINKYYLLVNRGFAAGKCRRFISCVLRR